MNKIRMLVHLQALHRVHLNFWFRFIMSLYRRYNLRLLKTSAHYADRLIFLRSAS